jgi:hypothetical protein
LCKRRTPVRHPAGCEHVPFAHEALFFESSFDDISTTRSGSVVRTFRVQCRPLRRLVEVGGKPIGTVGYAFIPLDDETNQKVLTCYSKLFSEWEGDDRMTKYFESLVADMMHDVESRYGKSMLGSANDN